MNQFTTSIWGDEGFSAILSMKSIPEIIKIIATDTSPPLYNITEHIAFQIFGVSEIVIRGLSFFYFLLAIFFVYKIGKLLWNKKTGIIAAALTFLNPFFFIYAFEGRMYSILALGVTASMYFFLKILKSRQGVSRFDFAGYVIASLWAMYSHHFAAFALILQGGWFVYEFFAGNRKVSITIFKAFIVIAVGYLPWVIPLYNQTKMVGGGFWLGTPTIDDLGFLIKEYLATGIRNNLAEPALYLVYAGLLLRRWGKDIKDSLYLLLWFLVPILLTWVVSQKFQSIFFNRYLLYAIPGAMLILSSNTRKAAYVVLAAIIGLFAIIDFQYFTHPTKRPFQELSAFVRQTRRGDDFLINWNSSAHHLWETKFYEIPAPIYIPEGAELPFFVGTALMTKDDIISELPKGAFRIGVVTSGPVEEVGLPGYTEEEVREFGELKFLWYKRKI